MTTRRMPTLTASNFATLIASEAVADVTRQKITIKKALCGIFAHLQNEPRRIEGQKGLQSVRWLVRHSIIQALQAFRSRLLVPTFISGEAKRVFQRSF